MKQIWNGKFNKFKKILFKYEPLSEALLLLVDQR